jgi:16S rRNA (adenine1518-N6/adenine1519-N6)-dimethyltransferase
MDLTNITNIKKILKAFGVYSRKNLGQHFLIDESALDTILDTARVSKHDNVVEVGPGMGILTRELLKRAREVTAIELDKGMIQVLKTACMKYKNLRIENKDVLKFNPNELGQYKVVSNLPYYITAPTIRHFLEAQNKPTEMILMVQKEVAERVCAKPGRMSTLAVSVQFYGAPSKIAVVPRTSFFPTPQVDSAIIKINVYKKQLYDVDTQIFFRIVKAGFGEKRKQLINSLSGGLMLNKETIEKILEKANVGTELRAEALSLDDWHNIYKSYLEIRA